MGYDLNFGWNGVIGQVILGATRSEGGTRTISYRIGGGTTLQFLDGNPSSPSPLVALEICDNPEYWSPIIKKYCGDLVYNVHEWAKAADTVYKADLVRLYPVSYTHLRAHETDSYLVCRLLLEK